MYGTWKPRKSLAVVLNVMVEGNFGKREIRYNVVTVSVDGI